MASSKKRVEELGLLMATILVTSVVVTGELAQEAYRATDGLLASAMADVEKTLKVPLDSLPQQVRSKLQAPGGPSTHKGLGAGGSGAAPSSEPHHAIRKRSMWR